MCSNKSITHNFDLELSDPTQFNNDIFPFPFFFN